MKREYKKPETNTIPCQMNVHLLTGSYKVNEYKSGSDINVGDEDE